MTHAAPTVPTAAELKEATRHVFYEVRMLVNTCDALGTPTLDDTPRNAFLESFGVHARALMDFLTQTRSDKDDVYAALYIKGYVPPTFSSVFDDVRNDINKHLAHVTFTRVRIAPPVQKEWNVHAIASALCGLIDQHFFQPLTTTGALHADWNGGVPRPALRAASAPSVATGMPAQYLQISNTVTSTTTTASPPIFSVIPKPKP